MCSICETFLNRKKILKTIPKSFPPRGESSWTSGLPAPLHDIWHSICLAGLNCRFFSLPVKRALL